MTQKGDRWSKRETQKLKDKWPDHTAEEIAGMLPGRTVEAVESKAQRLNEKGELPDKNRSTSSRTSHSTSQKQVEKGGSQVRTVSGEIEEVKRDAPRSMGVSNAIGLKINGEWFYDTYSPSRFEDTGKGIAFQVGGELFTVKGARLSGADYTVEDSGSGQNYNRLQSYGTIQKGNATEISQTKEVEIKKSQLFEDFHQAMLSRATGRSESFVLEVWDHKDSVKEKWKSSGEYYSGKGPVATLGYKNLSSVSLRGRNYHLSKQDVVNDVVDATSKTEDEVSERDIEVNFEATNHSTLQDLWNARNDVLTEEELKNPHAFDNSQYEQIEVEWVDDTSAEAFLEEKFDFY
ncbi:hypothetical protein [Haloferax sp. Q22]|uniref:hypothetical protein n=1 Tax=Haloferax sp. (strain Q22) TaxID=1526048 RepID=UPI000737B133|nr:hypothetical protein [Haloferax sp. Q22]